MPPPRASRPRSPRVDRAILDATLRLFVTSGPDAMSMEQIAATAGVGKAAIYRRWPSKEAVVMAAIANAFVEPSRPNTGSVRLDLIESAQELHALMSSPDTGGVFPPMAAELARNTPLGRDYAERVIKPRREILAAALQRGADRGELTAAVDVELAVDFVVGSILLRRLTGRLAPTDAEFPVRVVDSVLAGLHTRSPATEGEWPQ